MTRGIPAIVIVTEQGGLLNQLHNCVYHNLIAEYKMYDDDVP